MNLEETIRWLRATQNLDAYDAALLALGLRALVLFEQSQKAKRP